MNVAPGSLPHPRSAAVPTGPEGGPGPHFAYLCARSAIHELRQARREELLRLSLDAINNGRDADALVMLKTILECDDNQIYAKCLLAAQYAQQGLYDRAEAGFRDVVVASPEFTVARFQLGQLLVMKGDAVQVRHTLAPLADNRDALGAYARAMLAAAYDDAVDAARELERACHCRRSCRHWRPTCSDCCRSCAWGGAMPRHRLRPASRRRLQSSLPGTAGKAELQRFSIGFAHVHRPPFIDIVTDRSTAFGDCAQERARDGSRSESAPRAPSARDAQALRRDLAVMVKDVDVDVDDDAAMSQLRSRVIRAVLLWQDLCNLYSHKVSRDP